jgi:UDP-N-acetylmuramoyl-L-alanyl-D-glutamate--2,6-diaminopimelate ligase
LRLETLLARLPEARLTGDASADVTEVTHDSRRVGAGALFVAIRGLVNDGNQFVDGARKRGAAVVVSERPPRPGGTWVQVGDARVALAVLSAAVNGDPGERLGLVGVTGTNGKTTTTHLIDAALRAAGEKAGLVGTVHYRIGDRLTTAVRTTPESSDLQALFREMADTGCRRAVLEVSSHSLELKRVYGCRFAVAVFTNLTRDHLDFHGDMDRYFEAKRRLFAEHLREDGRAVINADDDRAPELVVPPWRRPGPTGSSAPPTSARPTCVCPSRAASSWLTPPWDRSTSTPPSLVGSMSRTCWPPWGRRWRSEFPRRWPPRAWPGSLASPGGSSA